MRRRLDIELAQSAVYPIVACAALISAAQAPARANDLELKIPPVKTAVNLQGQAVTFTLWGAVTPLHPDTYRVSLNVDLGDLQNDISALLAAQLNRSDRCGERLTVQGAELEPTAPSSRLKAYVRYERFACVKALGKEVVKRLIGGNAVAEINLDLSVADDHPVLAAQVRKIDADGSLGEVLHSGSFGDSLREKAEASIQSAVRKATVLESVFPAEIANTAAIRGAQFADGGAGRLWLTIVGEMHLSEQQFRVLGREQSR